MPRLVPSGDNRSEEKLCLYGGSETVKGLEWMLSDRAAGMMNYTAATRRYRII
ncbi:TPA: hypothetical protein HA231_02420 [Candidatus Woesearchaeota archaeon]|nr:hypothetical protein [Candidatus Woesearchaeota archaeon]